MRGDFQIYGTDVGPVRQRLAGGPPKFWEGTLSLDPARETSKGVGVDLQVSSMF